TERTIALSKTKPRRTPGPAGKFPFRFGRQTILETVRQSPLLHLIQFLQPRLTVLQTHLLHRQPITSKITRFRIEVTHLFGHRRPFLLHHREYPQPKTAADFHFRLRPFVVRAACFPDGAAHLKTAWS